jgi:hypothetical protein
MAILGCNSDSTSVGPNNGFEEFLPNPPSAAPKAIREMASIDSDHVTVGSDLFLQEKKIQKNANLDLEVKNVDDALVQINDRITQFNGEIISSSSGGVNFGQPFVHITLRVPSSSFLKLLENLKEIATTVISENIFTNDVTEEYIDIEAKLKVMKNTEHRFSDLLQDTKNVEEILLVEKELMRIRGEIDSLEGRFKYLNQTTMNSQIDLNVSQEVPITGKKWRVGDSFTTALRNLSSFSKNIAELFINVLVFLPIIIPIIIVIIFARKYWLKPRK